MRRILEWKPPRKRPKGRPRTRRIENILDLETIGVRNWGKKSAPSVEVPKKKKNSNKSLKSF